MNPQANVTPSTRKDHDGNGDPHTPERTTFQDHLDEYGDEPYSYTSENGYTVNAVPTDDEPVDTKIAFEVKDPEGNSLYEQDDTTSEFVQEDFGSDDFFAGILFLTFENTRTNNTYEKLGEEGQQRLIDAQKGLYDMFFEIVGPPEITVEYLKVENGEETESLNENLTPDQLRERFPNYAWFADRIEEEPGFFTCHVGVRDADECDKVEIHYQSLSEKVMERQIMHRNPFQDLFESLLAEA